MMKMARRLEPDAGRHAADHDDGARPRPHRDQRRPSRRDAGRAAAGRTTPSTWSSTGSSSRPATSATTGRTPASGSPPRTATSEEYHYPLGQTMDRFTAQGGPGLLLLHAPGNTFIRDLRQGERILIQPGGLIWKDRSVRMFLHFEYPQGQLLVQLRPLAGQVHLAGAAGPGPGRHPVGVRAPGDGRRCHQQLRRHDPVLVDAVTRSAAPPLQPAESAAAEFTLGRGDQPCPQYRLSGDRRLTRQASDDERAHPLARATPRQTFARLPLQPAPGPPTATAGPARRRRCARTPGPSIGRHRGCPGTEGPACPPGGQRPRVPHRGTSALETAIRRRPRPSRSSFTAR